MGDEFHEDAELDFVPDVENVIVLLDLQLFSGELDPILHLQPKLSLQRIRRIKPCPLPPALPLLLLTHKHIIVLQVETLHEKLH